MLHEGQTRWRLEVTFSFLCRRMWRMVSRNDVDALVVQRRYQCLTVCCALYRGIAFDLRTQLIVMRFIEPQMMHTNFGGNSFL